MPRAASRLHSRCGNSLSKLTEEAKLLVESMICKSLRVTAGLHTRAGQCQRHDDASDRPNCRQLDAIGAGAATEDARERMLSIRISS